MKGLVRICAGAALALALTAGAAMAADAERIFFEIGNSRALVGGEIVQIDPDNADVIVEAMNNRTMVPLRFISENFGYDVGWNPDGTIPITSGDKTVVFQLGSNIMTVNGEEVVMDVEPVAKNNRTLISVRWLLEALDKKVGWNNGVVSISSEEVVEMDNYTFTEAIKKAINDKNQGINYINPAKRLEIKDRIYSNLGTEKTISYDDVVEIYKYFVSEFGDDLGLNISIKIEQGIGLSEVHHAAIGDNYRSEFTVYSNQIEHCKSDETVRNNLVANAGYFAYIGYDFITTLNKPTIISFLLGMEKLIIETYPNYTDKAFELSELISDAYGDINIATILSLTNSSMSDKYVGYSKTSQSSIYKYTISNPITNYDQRINGFDFILEEGMILLSQNPNYSTATNAIFDENGNKRTYAGFLEQMDGFIKNESNPELVQEYYNTMYYGAYYFGYTTAPNYQEAKKTIEEYRQKYIDGEILCTDVNQLFTPVDITKTQIDDLWAGLL